MAELSKFTFGFRSIVDEHLIRLRKGAGNQPAFAKITRISPSQIYDWYSGKRLPGRDRISEICFRLAEEYQRLRDDKDVSEAEKPTDSEIGPKTLDGMLNEMLEAVGYCPVVGARRDRVWTRLLGGEEGRKLTIAWVDYPPFAYKERGQLCGVAVDIMQRVAKLSGVVPHWQPCNWTNLIPSVRSGEVDLVAPILLELPSRMFQVAFSTPIPCGGIAISGLIRRDCESEIKARGLRLNYVEGEAGEALSTMFAPDVSASDKHTNFDAACEAIKAHGQDDEGRVHCLVADHVICKEREAASANLLKTISPSAVGGASEAVRLPIAAAVHLEEPQLLGMLNRCLGILAETKWFDSLWKKPDGERIMEILKTQPKAEIHAEVDKGTPQKVIATRRRR